MEKMKIRALIMDVDGTLTDGRIFMGSSGEIMKAFYVRDGLAIKHILPEHGIVPIIITGRSSEITARRCEELGITDIVQSSEDKISEMLRILAEKGISPEEAAYIGDDINDIACMKAVGLSGCPADAAREVREISGFVAGENGGHGAVREFIDYLVRN